MTIKEVYETSIDKWAKSRGVGTITYDASIDLFEPIKMILNKYFARNPNDKVIIITATESRKAVWVDKLFTNFNHFDKIGKNQLLFLSADYITSRDYKDEVELLIIDQVEHFTKIESRVNILRRKYIKAKFICGVTNDPYPDGEGFILSDYLPVVHRMTKVDIVTTGVLDGTVEFNVPVTLSEGDKQLYAQYGEFIKDTITICDSFDNVLKCYHGDKVAGISADYFRNKLAASKGWHKDIDVNNEYYANIERYYNPHNIYERAKAFTNIIQKRNILQWDNAAKLTKIVEIVRKFKDKKILIINKRFQFAKEVSDAINLAIENDTLKKTTTSSTLFTSAEPLTGAAFNVDVMSVEYHAEVEPRPLIDSDTDEYIRIKSGVNKGKIKKFGATVLNRIANERFNDGHHNVISSVSSIPKAGSFEIDFIIMTSPDCNTLSELQYRVSKLKFKENVRIINLYVDATREVDKLRDKQALTNNKIVAIKSIDELNF